jgi:hypothetical protein
VFLIRRIPTLAQFSLGRQPIVDILTVFSSALDIPFVRALRNEIPIDLSDHDAARILRSSVLALSDLGHTTSKRNSHATRMGFKNRVA